MARSAVYICCALAATIGAVYGFRFGVQISGPGLGFLVGLNAAIFSALVIGMLLDRLFPPRRSPPPDGD